MDRIPQDGESRETNANQKYRKCPTKAQNVQYVQARKNRIVKMGRKQQAHSHALKSASVKQAATRKVRLRRESRYGTRVLTSTGLEQIFAFAALLHRNRTLSLNTNQNWYGVTWMQRASV